jgi:hypothetical protein
MFHAYHHQIDMLYGISKHISQTEGKWRRSRRWKKGMLSSGMKEIFSSTCRKFLSFTISSAIRLEGYVDMGGILHFVRMKPV